MCLVLAIRSVDLIADPKKLVNNGEHLNEVLSRRASIGGEQEHQKLGTKCV